MELNTDILARRHSLYCPFMESATSLPAGCAMIKCVLKVHLHEDCVYTVAKYV